eukprot:gene8669-9381_t
MKTFLTLLLILLPLIRCRYTLKTIIGSNIPGIIGNGDPATNIPISVGRVSGLAVDSAGSIYLSESEAGYVERFTTFLANDVPSTKPTSRKRIVGNAASDIPTLSPTASPSSSVQYYLTTVAGLGPANASRSVR